MDEYKKFFDDCPVALVRTDLRTGQFLMANEAAATMLGFNSVDDLLKNGNATQFYSKPVRQRLIREIKKQGSIRDYDVKLTLKDGRDVWVSACFHINCGGSCIEGSLTDITELVMLKEKQLDMARTIAANIDRLAKISA